MFGGTGEGFMVISNALYPFSSLLLTFVVARLKVFLPFNCQKPKAGFIPNQKLAYALIGICIVGISVNAVCRQASDRRASVELSTLDGA